MSEDDNPAEGTRICSFCGKEVEEEDYRYSTDPDAPIICDDGPDSCYKQIDWDEDKEYVELDEDDIDPEQYEPIESGEGGKFNLPSVRDNPDSDIIWGDAEVRI